MSSIVQSEDITEEKHMQSMFSLVISQKLNNRKHSLPKLELEDLSDLLYTPIILSLVATPS